MIWRSPVPDRLRVKSDSSKPPVGWFICFSTPFCFVFVPPLFVPSPFLIVMFCFPCGRDAKTFFWGFWKIMYHFRVLPFLLRQFSTQTLTHTVSVLRLLLTHLRWWFFRVFFFLRRHLFTLPSAPVTQWHRRDTAWRTWNARLANIFFLFSESPKDLPKVSGEDEQKIKTNVKEGRASASEEENQRDKALFFSGQRLWWFFLVCFFSIHTGSLLFRFVHFSTILDMFCPPRLFLQCPPGVLVLL